VTTVLVADDQELIRAGLVTILSKHGFDVVAVADGSEAVARATALRPEVAVLDVRMPGLDGVAATRAITALPEPTPKVLILTTFALDDYLFRALRHGAAGFLLKRTADQTLVPAIRAVLRGDAFIEPHMTRRLVDAHPLRSRAGTAPIELAALSDRELDVLVLLATGRSNAEIAATLVVEESTVKTHVHRVLTKLGVRSRVQAALWAYEHDIARLTAKRPRPGALP